MACLALVVVLRLRGSGEPVSVVIVEGVAIAAWLVLTAWVSRSAWMALRFGRLWQRRILVVMAISGLAISTLSRWIVAAMGGRGTAWEMVMLTTLAVAAGLLVAASTVEKSHSLSVVCGGFLMLFATAISDNGDAIYLALAWVAICLWWMVANHWERLELHMPGAIRRQSGLRFGATASGFLIFGLALTVTWGRGPSTRLIGGGWMPTSGGQRWNDPAARSGIGDGDAVIAAKQHAASFGPVESDLFLQSDLPSLFDMFDDTIGEPAIRRRSEKAVGLQNQMPTDQQQHFAQSQQGGAAFSAARERSESPANLRDRKTTAVLHWVGPVGVRLAIERFDNFDGVDWTAVAAGKTPRVKTRGGGDPLLQRREMQDAGVWYFRSDLLRQNNGSPQSSAGLFRGSRGDAVKFINFRSPRIPTPTTTVGIHIADVDRDDFFEITADGSWRMPDRETVPSLTVVRMVTHEIDGDRLRNWNRFPMTSSPSVGDAGAAANASLQKGHIVDPADGPPGHRLGMSLAASLAKQWTHDLSRGWPQIEAVIDRLRNDFAFDRSADSDAEDPLGGFLRTGRGGDHLFATAATVMLQSLGYEARLATGFYAPPGNIARLGGHIEIGPEDVHAWAEVRADEGVWIPLEPTPGYLPPRFYRSWWSLATLLAWSAIPWILGLSAGIILLWWSRSAWGEWLCRVVWWCSSPLGSRRRMAVLVRILDIRSVLVRAPRPMGTTPRQWYCEIMGRIDESLTPSVHHFFDTADAIVFGNQATPPVGWMDEANRVAAALTAGRIGKCHREFVGIAERSPFSSYSR